MAETDTQQATTGAPVRPRNREPYQQAYYPPVPTAFTRHIRVNPVWQFYRLLVINWKILKLLTRSNH